MIEPTEHDLVFLEMKVHEIYDAAHLVEPSWSILKMIFLVLKEVYSKGYEQAMQDA